MPRQLSIEEIAENFGKAHKDEAEAKERREGYRKLFFEKIRFKTEELARQIVYYEGDDPDGYVAAIYPKWHIIKRSSTPDPTSDKVVEWKLILEEDPRYKSYVLINPRDGLVYQRVVTESAPNVDLERLKAEKPAVYMSVTYKPDPPRELKPLEKLTDDQKEVLKEYLLPPKLTPTMQKPRKPKEDELEDLHSK